MIRYFRNCIGLVPGSQTLTVVGGVEGIELSVIQIDVTEGEVIKVGNLSASWFNQKR